MMNGLAERRCDDAEDLARLWRPLVLKAALRALVATLVKLATWRGGESGHYPRFELSDRALHDIGLNRLGAGRLDAVRGAIRPLRR